MSAIRCSYACTSGPCEPGPTTPPGTGGSAAHGGWMIAVGGRVVVVGAGAVVVVGAGAVVGAGWARFVVFSSRSAEPATATPDTKSAATTRETSTGGRKTCLRGAPVDARKGESYRGGHTAGCHAVSTCPAGGRTKLDRKGNRVTRDPGAGPGVAVRFFSFHLMPYTQLSPDYDGPAWVTCPNELYDPQVGNELYNTYLDELLYAEEVGFDGVCVNEHHQNAYGNMPSPNLIAAMLARRTSRVKIAVVGNALPLYGPPLRVAEEWAMLDVITGGRLICGMVIGGGPEYFS